MAEFTVLANAEEVAEDAAADIAQALRDGARNVVLTGGTSPIRCYELLSELDVEWGRVAVLFGDERCVPPLDPESNYRMVLGVGEDGHVMSLFPGHKALKATGLTVGIHDSPKPPPERVSLTMDAIADAGRILIIATGAGKAQAVAMARRGEGPSGMIANARWLIDRAAAGQSHPPATRGTSS